MAGGVEAAGEAAAVRLSLNDEVIACGVAPRLPVRSGTATAIATGGPVPRGADAIVMIEYTQALGADAIEVRRAVTPGQFVSYAGSDIARGESLLRAGTLLGSPEIGMLAACGIASVTVVRRPRVAVLSSSKAARAATTSACGDCATFSNPVDRLNPEAASSTSLVMFRASRSTMSARIKSSPCK